MPTVGSVGVEVVPDARGWNAKLKAQLLPEADALGLDIGKHLREGIDAELHDVKVGAEFHDEEARAEIERLKLEIDELSHKKAKVDVTVNNASGVRSWLTSLVAGAVAIAPAFVVAATGIAAFAALAAPSISKVIKYEHELGVNAAKAAQQYQGMTAGQQLLATQVTGLRAEFSSLATAVQPQVLQVFGAAVQQLNQFLPILVPLAQAGGRALTTLINDVGGVFNGPAGKQFFDFVSKNLATDVSQIGATVDSLIKTFFSLTESLQPVSLGLLNVLRVGADFLSWLTRVAPPIDDVIVLAIALYKPLKALQGLELAATFSNLSKALTGVKAAGGSGTSFGWIATAVAGIKQIAAESIAAAEAQKILEASAATSGAGLRVFSVGAAGAAEELAVMTRGEKAAAVAAGLLEAVNPLVWVAGAAVAIGALAVAADKPLLSFKSLTDQFERQFQAIGPNVSALHQLTDSYIATQHAVSGLEGPFAGFYARVIGEQSQAQVRSLAINLDEMAQAFGLTRGQAERVAQSLPGVVKGFEQGGAAAAKARQTFIAWAMAGAQGVGVMTRLQVETNILGNSMTTAAQKAQELGAAFKALVSPTLDLADAAVQAKQAQVGLAAALAKSHDRLGTATQAERDATTATTDAARKAEAYSQQLLQTGASAGRAAGPMQALVHELEAAGAKGGAAAKIIAELRAQIAALHGKQIRIEIDEAVVSSGGGAPAGGIPGIRTAGGAVFPGYAPGQDTIGPVWVSPGEGVAVPELVQAIGPARFMELNRQYSGGRKSTPAHFAAGGVAGTSLAHRSVAGGDEFDVILNILSNAPAYTVSKTGVSGSERLAREFRDAVNKSTAQIRDMGRTALKDLKDYYTGPHSLELRNALNRQVTALEHLSTRSQRIADEIKAERQYAQQETQSLKSFSDISAITGTTDPATGVTAPVTGAQIGSGLQKDLAQLRKFEQVIKALKRAKVVRVLIEQVIALGPVDGVTYGEAILSGGATLIRELNKEEREIAREEKRIGQTAAEIHYGQSVSKGFLPGLKKERAQLEREMHHLGDEIARELLDALHGKLPRSHPGGGGAHAHAAAAALSGSTLAGAYTVGGTTISRGGLTRTDIADIRGSLRRIEVRELQTITRQQGARLIGLLHEIAKDSPAATGTAVAKALDGSAGKAAGKARASTR